MITMIPLHQRTEDIRSRFLQEYKAHDKNEDALQIIGASFIADEPTIFGTVNRDYIRREIDWYLKQSLYVKDLEDAPTIWKEVADDEGKIHSNYGYLIFNRENYHQYKYALNALVENQNTKRATMIYTRPSIIHEQRANGMRDMICTNAVSYYIQNRQLHVVVQMRSNDAVFGYKNDYAWQKYVQDVMIADLASKGIFVDPGMIIWQVQNLHIYKRHYYLLEKELNNANLKGKRRVFIRSC